MKKLSLPPSDPPAASLKAEGELSSPTRTGQGQPERPTGAAEPALVWPPPDHELDDWQVIALKDSKADPPSASPAEETAARKRPLPQWLVNHTRTREEGSRTKAAQPETTNDAGAAARDETAFLGPLWPRPSSGSSASVGASSVEASASPSSSRRAAARTPESSARIPPDTLKQLDNTAPLVSVTPSVSAPRRATATGHAAAAPLSLSSHARHTPVRRQSSWSAFFARRVAVVLLALVALGQSAYIGARLLLAPAAAAPPSTLIIESAPMGAEVFLDGERRGVTPFRTEAAPGEHSLELRKNGRVRAIPLVLAAGVQASHYVEMSNATVRLPANSADANAQPRSTDRSAGARSTPGLMLTTPGLSSSVASPALQTASSALPTGSSLVGSSTTSTVPEARTASEPTTSSPRVSSNRGWVIVESPLNLSVLRGGELVGNSVEGRLPLAAGRHELELVNDSVGYRSVITVQVPPGRAARLPINLPQSTMTITATPSARVWVDGRAVGETPITQLALLVGPHEVRFQHPELGERRVTVLVRIGVTAQATVEFTR
jgi:PEGA domain